MSRSYYIAWLVLSLAVQIPAQTSSSIRNEDARDEVLKIIKTISTDSIKWYDNKLSSFGTRHTMSDTTSRTRGIGAARRWIMAQFRQFADADPDFSVHEDSFVLDKVTRISRETRLVNVYGLLRGSEGPAGRYVVISGHYDSRCTDIMNDSSDAPGADDDGSGSSLAIEAARAFTSLHFKPQANIIFICFAGEEQGLYGSEHFASESKKNTLNIVADLNNDIVGSIRGGNGVVENNVVRVFSESYGDVSLGERKVSAAQFGYENDSPSRELARYIYSCARKYLPAFEERLIYRQDRFLRGGDQSSFNKHGYAAVRFTEPNEDFHHQHQDVRTESENVDGKEEQIQYGDLPQYVDSAYLANVCRVNSLAAALISIAPPAPMNAKMLVDRLEYGTRIRCDNPSRGDGIAGWKVYFRRSDGPFWSDYVFEKTSSDPTVEIDLNNLSKDDYIFSVAAVGTNGAESVPVAPLPGR